MAQRVGVHPFFETCPLRREEAGVPDGLRPDRLRGRMMATSWEEPHLGLEVAPVLPQALQQDGAEHHVSIFPAFAALDVHDHARAVDIKDFESSDLRTARAGPVEGHQNGAVEGAGCGVNEPGDFFLAQDRGEAEPHLGVGRLGRAPRFLERLDEEEAQSREVLGDGAGG